MKVCENYCLFIIRALNVEVIPSPPGCIVTHRIELLAADQPDADHGHGLFDLQSRLTLLDLCAAGPLLAMSWVV